MNQFVVFYIRDQILKYVIASRSDWPCQQFSKVRKLEKYYFFEINELLNPIQCYIFMVQCYGFVFIFLVSLSIILSSVQVFIHKIWTAKTSVRAVSVRQVAHHLIIRTVVIRRRRRRQQVGVVRILTFFLPIPVAPRLRNDLFFCVFFNINFHN